MRNSVFGIRLLGIVALGSWGSALVAPQSGWAFWPSKKNAAIEVLVQDAIVWAAFSATQIGIREGIAELNPEARVCQPRLPIDPPYDSEACRDWSESPDWSNHLHLPPILYFPSSPHPLDLVNNVVGIPFSYGGHVSGLEVARDAGNAFASRPEANTWAAATLIEESKNAFVRAQQEGLDRELSMVRAAQAVWDWILVREGDYRKNIDHAVRWKWYPPGPYVKTNFDAQQLVAMLETVERDPRFKKGLPAYQEFYLKSVEKIRAELRIEPRVGARP